MEIDSRIVGETILKPNRSHLAIFDNFVAINMRKPGWESRAGLVLGYLLKWGLTSG